MHENEATTAERQLIVFTLGDEAYGADISAVREIVRVPEVSNVSGGPEFVVGVADLIGEVMPVVDLRRRFSMPASKYGGDRRVVVASIAGDGSVGMIVDAVTEVVRATETMVEPVDSELLTGTVQSGETLVRLLDLEKVISPEEAEQVLSMAQDEAA